MITIKVKIMIKEYYEDYKMGEIFISPGRTITETDIVLFASLTGDWWEGHTNVEFAKKGVFGQRIAHGLLTLCIGTSLLFRLGDNVFLPRFFIANYGMENLRFTAPVMIGDTIRCEAKVSEMIEKDAKRGVLTYDIRVLNQRDENVIIFMEKALVGRRPAD
ncbi:MAG: MaoC/PaaZ C-terminal domain-containing protein [Thermodesulfobacteriota bacterium]|nr:MaoC/PaaZ C-terminal domain-containing protein [Thermodesulfobacteriota bacterium]